jgi:hypothetical protein
VLSRALGSAVLLFPLVDDLWILAGDWEFCNDCNIVAARSLMLRGIRSNPNSRKLWLEYFRLELMYLDKIKTRIDLVTHKTNEIVRNVDVDQEEEEEMMFVEQQEEAPTPVPNSAVAITDTKFFKGFFFFFFFFCFLFFVFCLFVFFFF